MASRTRSLWRGWERFWFAPIDVAVFAPIRICYAAIVLTWALTLGPDLGAFFSRHGLVGSANPPAAWWDWSLLDLSSSDFAVASVFVALVAAALALLLGWHSRIAAAVVFPTLTTLIRADPYVFNSGDTLLRLIAFYLMLAPCGARLSLDYRRQLGRRREPPATHAAWPLRLMQIQLAAIYAGAVAAKLAGPSWRGGTAVSYAMQLGDLTRVPAPAFITQSPFGAAVATYGTLAVEAGLVVLLWPRRTRAAALCVGVAFHLGIDALLRVGFFSLAVLTLYLSFVGRPGAESRRRARYTRRDHARSGYRPKTARVAEERAVSQQRG
jgi:vitamin K-dependent gamma-carboxylase-like protein